MIDFDPPQNAIDWDDLKQRLARANEALSRAGELSPQEAQRVMDERARMLAQTPTRALDRGTLREYITFQWDDERFALQTRFVLEVTRPNQVVPMPAEAEFLVGLANLRGELLAILELRPLFGLERTPPAGEASQILVIGEAEPEFGLLIDGVGEVMTLAADELLDPPDSLPASCRGHVAGVTAQSMIVLDAEALIRDETLFVDEID